MRTASCSSSTCSTSIAIDYDKARDNRLGLYIVGNWLLAYKSKFGMLASTRHTARAVAAMGRVIARVFFIGEVSIAFKPVHYLLK
jgi:hypothetical protein